MLTIQDLSVVYPDKTVGVDRLSLTLKDGESVALIGANGAGKTSLILAMVGVLPVSGRLAVDGLFLDKTTADQIRARIGVVFQNPDDQLFMPTVYEDIAFGLRNAGLAEQDIKERAGRCLEQLHIGRLRDRSALKLSGGEKRMAALATVLVMEPSVMLFDEPTAFLDPRARRNLIHTLGGLSHTKLIATHDLSFAAQVCERSVLLKDGRVFADGRSKDLLYDVDLMDLCGVEAIGAYETGVS